MDDIETVFGTKVEEMSPDQLLSYFEKSKSSVLRVKVAPGGIQARKTFEGFCRRYGQEDAGRIVKYAVHKKKCRTPSGDVLTTSSFAEGNAWITDTFHAELQLEENRFSDNQERTQELKKGFFSLRDL